MLFPILSLIGFVLATASGLLALSSVVYAHVIGGFPYYDPRLLRIYAWGGVLSLSGIVFGIFAVPSAVAGLPMTGLSAADADVCAIPLLA